MPTMNATHRKRLARALAEQQGIAYMAALDKVTKAAVAGRLPTILDEAGMQASLRVLSTSDDETAALAVSLPSVPAPEDAPVRRMASDPRDQVLYDLSFEYEQITGQQGLLYITSPDGRADKYVFGGGFVALGRKEALGHLETHVADARLLRGGGDRYYLIPEALRLLRQVWQGRVTLTAVGWDRKRTRFTIDDKPASDINDLHLRWLHKHLYFEANLSPAEKWAVARTTDFGDAVLARNRADVDKFHDGLPPERPATAHPQPPPFSTEGTVEATVRGLLRVRDVFEKAGRVEWWWHVGPFAGSHGFKTVDEVDETDGSLILRNEEPGAIEPTTRLVLDFIDDPEEASQHLLWPVEKRAGVTLRDARGNIDATYKVAPLITSSQADLAHAAEEVATQAQAFVVREPLSPDVDRLMGGPYVTKVYDSHDRRVNATCDICNRRLATGEPWWMVHSPDRNWESNAGVVCGLHQPDRLPQHTLADQNTAAAASIEADALPGVHAARPGSPVAESDGVGHCAVCLQRVKRVPGGQGKTWIHTGTGAVAAAGEDPARPVSQPTAQGE